MLIKASTIAGLALPLLSLSDYTSASATINPVGGGGLRRRSSSFSSPSITPRHKPNLARWAEFSRSIQSANNGRRAHAAAAAKRAAADGVVGVPQPRYSPLPPLDGATITKTVAQQIKNDVTAVIGQFADLPSDIQNVLKTALGNILSQQIYTDSPEKQYEIVSTSIMTQLNKIEESLPKTLWSLDAPLDDTVDFNALRNCIDTIVAMGGITNEDQGTCLSNSGYSLESLKSQFNQFVDMNTFVIPANAVNDAVKNINEYLDSIELVPALEYLIGNASASLQNVVLTVQANEKDATIKAFECWMEAIQTISDVKLQERERLCNTGRGKGTKGTALEELEEAFIAKSNQYNGVLPPILSYNIQRIGITALTLATDSYEANTRDAINTAIWSATAATSGESATIVNDLIKCLNTMYDSNLDNNCNPNANEEILQHNENIYYNYLAQFASILPKTLVQNLNTTVLAQLEGEDGPEAESLKQQLEQLWKQASLGTEYEACEIEFNQCVIQAMTKGTSTTTCTQKMGAACKEVPSSVPGQIDSGTPYGDIAAGLTGDGKWGGAARHKRFQRAVRKIANDHAAASKRGMNPVRRSGLELLSVHDI